MNRTFLSTTILLACSLCSTTVAYARTLEGQGYGRDIQQARSDALSALANNIYVNVESNTEIYQDNTGTDDFSYSANLTTNIPVYGVEYQCKKSKKEYLCAATLDTKEALPVYKAEIANIVEVIDEKYSSLEGKCQNEKLEVLYSLLGELDQYEKLSVMARYLSEHNIKHPTPSTNVQQINTEIVAHEDAVTNLNVAGNLIANRVTYENVFIKPATLQHSREVTPFASALTDEIKMRIDSTSNEDTADYILEGQYAQNKSGIRVNYSLSDRKGNTVTSVVINLLPKSYAQYRTTPLAPDFDQLLHHGYAISSDFKTALATNKGLRSLLFKQGEEVEILMKMNQPGYYYIVGYTKNEGTEQSYLLDLNDAPGDRRFIGYLNADDANKWVSLGEFVVDEPFGIESIQLMGSTTDLVGMLPPHRYEVESGYYVISHDIEQGVELTRGLKKAKTKKTQTAESVLMFTTQSN